MIRISNYLFHNYEYYLLLFFSNNHKINIDPTSYHKTTNQSMWNFFFILIQLLFAQHFMELHLSIFDH